MFAKQESKPVAEVVELDMDSQALLGMEAWIPLSAVEVLQGGFDPDREGLDDSNN